MNAIKDSSFEDATVLIDGSSYENCHFKNVVLQYGASAPTGFRRCEFVECRWEFIQAANRTVEFMRAMFHGMGEGGPQVVKQIFEYVRSEPGTQPVSSAEELVLLALRDRQSPLSPEEFAKQQGHPPEFYSGVFQKLIADGYAEPAEKGRPEITVTTRGRERLEALLDRTL